MRYSINICLLLISLSCFGQGSGITVYGIDTRPAIDEYNLVTLDSLEGTVTLADIYRWHRPAWIAKYQQVIVSSQCNEARHSVTGLNDTLSEQQVALLRMADMDCAVDVDIDYTPNNHLANNPSRKISFALKVVPIYQANYPGGYDALQEYLVSRTINRIPEAIFNTIEVAKLLFTVTSSGQVTNARIATTTKDEATDQLLTEVLCQMPNWSPARNLEGHPIDQEFEFSIGTLLLQGCYRY